MAPVGSEPADGLPGGLQHERTSLAWERTAIAMMVAGVVLARYGAQSVHFTIGLFGVAETAAGGMLLAWAGSHDAELHDPARPASAVPQVGLTRLIGLVTLGFATAALALAMLIALS